MRSEKDGMPDLGACPFCGHKMHLAEKAFANGEKFWEICGQHPSDCLFDDIWLRFDEEDGWTAEAIAEAWNTWNTITEGLE